VIINLALASEISFQPNRPDIIEVTMRTEPNPKWKHIDRAGHEHRWIRWGDGYRLPTLEKVVDGEETDESGESYPTRWHYECPDCREVIEPGTQPGQSRIVRGIAEKWVMTARFPLDMFESFLDAFTKNESCDILAPGAPSLAALRGKVIAVKVLDGLGKNVLVTIRGE
jgi:hypothetical protein